MEMIDVGRCRRAMRNLYIQGEPGTTGGPDSRGKMLEDAIASIQADGVKAMSAGYFGIKNYSGFGDQRSDCEYGMGPRHGHIVFSIGRTAEGRKGGVQLGEDEVYLLECVRDFGGIVCPVDPINRPYWQNDSRPVSMNLTDVLRAEDEIQRLAKVYSALLETARVESHAGLVPAERVG